jgi:tetratricopeptide (TPR) repeat protein
MRPASSLLRLLFAVLFAATASVASAQIGRVGGVVKDEAGLPLKGITVTAQNPNIGQSFTATTDDKGRFSMIGLRAGQWSFIAQAPGFSPEGGAMAVRMGAPNPPIAFVLKRTGVAAFGALGGITSHDLQADLDAADALYDQKRWDAAIEGYRKVMSRSAALAVINLRIAAAARGKGDNEAAVAAYNALLAVDPANGKALLGLADTRRAQGDSRGAETVLRTAGERQDASRDVLFALGELSFDRNIDEAAGWYQKAAAADPIWGKPVYKLGLCAIKKGNNSDAMAMLTRAIAIDPTSPEAALAKSSLELLNK